VGCSGLGSGAFTSFVSGLAHPVGLTVGEHDGGVVQEPVEDAGGGGVLGQEPAPLLERPVRGDRQGSAFVGAGDESEQQLGAGVVEWREPDLVDDDQICPQQRVDGLADGGGAPCT